MNEAMMFDAVLTLTIRILKAHPEFDRMLQEKSDDYIIATINSMMRNARRR